MKRMKFLLQLVGATALTMGAGLTVVACNNGTANSLSDISTGVSVDDLQIAATTNNNYGALNTDININGAVAAEINTAKNVSVVAGTDFIITNDQNAKQKQGIGVIVNFTVTAIGDQIKGSFTFTKTLSMPDISTGVVVNDLLTPASGGNYSALNTNDVILSAVVTAINSNKKLNISKNDIFLTNDQNPVAVQTIGTKVTFTVKARSSSSAITGNFTFTDTLGKADISGVNVTDLKTSANLSNNFNSLNSDTNVMAAVTNAINNTLGINITNSDISISNNQTGNQVVGAVVIFTVSASLNSNAVVGSFQFIDTLSKVSISNGITVPDPVTSPNNTLTYASLNTNMVILGRVANAINNAKGTSVTTADITLTNNQTPTALQVAGTVVTITVTANASSSQIAGSFTFIDTLGKVAINSAISIPDLKLSAVTNATYASLNTNNSILSAVISAINTAKGTTITANDITLTNDHSGNQVAGTIVNFTVTANTSSSQITGNFTFANTLTLPNISTGVTITDPQTAVNTIATYGSLNTNTTLTAAVATAINTAKGTNVTANDFTLTNNQAAGASQVPGTIVVFTVTSNSTSTLIVGSFQFTNTLGKINISTGVSVSDLLTPPDSSTTYGMLNTSTNIGSSISNAIYAAKNINTVLGVDYTLTNNQSASTVTTVGTVVTFTVTAIGSKLTGSFTFTDTIRRLDLSTAGIVFPNYRTPANSSTTYAGLNNSTSLLNAIAATILQQKGITVTPGLDFSLSNNQNGSATPVSGTNVYFTINGGNRLTSNTIFINSLT